MLDVTKVNKRQLSKECHLGWAIDRMVHMNARYAMDLIEAAEAHEPIEEAFMLIQQAEMIAESIVPLVERMADLPGSAAGNNTSGWGTSLPDYIVAARAKVEARKDAVLAGGTFS